MILQEKQMMKQDFMKCTLNKQKDVHPPYTELDTFFITPQR